MTRLIDRHQMTDAKPTYRRCLCSACAAETWHEWHRGHRWTCACGAVRVEDVWNHHEPAEVADAPAVQLALI